MNLPPLHLMLPLWSQPRQRIDDFLSIGARMLLAPGNLPAVAKDRKVLIHLYTTPADWRYITSQPITSTLRRYAIFHPTFFDLDESISKHITMSRGHRIQLEVAAVAKALAVPIFADSVFADGDLKRLAALATGAPRRMVMALGWRVQHERLIEALPQHAARPIALPPRDVIRLTLIHRHSQMRCWAAENPGYGTDIMGGPQWSIGETGVITHSVYWEPALIDFSHPWEQDSSPVEEWTIDGHYAWVNTLGPETYHAVTNSDEFFHLTTARETGPLAYHFEHHLMQGTLVQEMTRARAHRTTDPLRQRLFEVRFRVHADDIDESWRAVETAADTAVRESAVPVRQVYKLAEYAAPVLLDTLNENEVYSYEGLYYVVSQSLGPINLENAEHRKFPGVSEHLSEEEARDAAGMRRDWRHMLPPVLLGQVGVINLVRYDGQVWALPQSLGPTDLELPEHRSRPGIQSFPTEHIARATLR